ncbi:lipopolysaccharide biosynthesis protein [Furfurilactobacillus entadae]|uniref:lipopolysaccharide biosynthesis protein n=1 Tax=Furfurilactobacillus entadae TaxID=2922307 RepID=UPI0035EF8538
MKSRTQNSIKNSTIAFWGQIIVLITQFATQTAFVKFLGAQYVGANGLFSNLLTLLSFADLGLGGAITFALYEPLAKGDIDNIQAIMALFRKTYHAIGTAILLMGLFFSLFIDHFINNSSTIPHVQMMFILFVINSAASYFFAYLRSLLVANQQGYVDTLNRVGFTFMQAVLQITFLAMFRQYIIFLLLQIFFTVTSNLALTRKTFRWFPYLRNRHLKTKISKESLAQIRLNVVGAIASRFGIVVSNGTDNLLLSSFIGLSIVGKYTSYMLIFNSSQNILNQAFSAVISSIANFSVDRKMEKEETIFFRYLYLVFGIALVGAISLQIVVQYFVVLWIGKYYLLPKVTVFLMVTIWFFNVCRYGVQGFITAHGLYWETKWKSILEALVNLGISLLLISTTSLGVNSVVIGTLTSVVAISLWWEPLIVKQKVRSISQSKLILFYGRGIGLYLLLSSAITIGHVSDYLLVHSFGINVLILIGVVLLTVLVYIIANFHAVEQKYYFLLGGRLMTFKRN